MLKHGDKIRITKADGAEKAGWAELKIVTRPVWNFSTGQVSIKEFYEIMAPCGEIYSPKAVMSMLMDSESWSTDRWRLFEGGRTPNYLCMFEQLLATGEMPGME